MSLANACSSRGWWGNLSACSNNDGCVIALSNELKAMGIKMGTPAFELQHLTRQGRIHLLSSNYELYGDMSARVQDVLEEFSAGVEPYSIDEMFVRFGGFAREQRLEHARQLHDRVRQYTGYQFASVLPPHGPWPSSPTALRKRFPTTAA